MLPLLDDLTALDQVLGAFETLLAPAARDTDQFFGNHPLPLNEFLEGMRVCRQHMIDRDKCWAGGNFIDIGCGLGTKMLIARHLGWDVAGLDHDPEMAVVATRLVADAPVAVVDAFDPALDLTGFDVVFSYRLCLDLGRQHELERHLSERMKPGTLLFVGGSWLNHVQHVAGQVWVV